MASKYQSLKGMDDLLPGAVERWQMLESRARSWFEGYGFREIRTPILESTELFQRSIGEASDIVHKEMYAFEDRGGRHITLRPEMTAAVVRAALEHHLIKPDEPLYLYYIGPMFRAERPQAGRKRQFHQIGVEALNTSSAENDGELMIMAHSFFRRLGLSKFTIRLNSLGTAEDRQRYAAGLVEFFAPKAAQLCSDCQFRLTKNVLRIFDCKVETCQPVIQKAPAILLSPAAEKDFAVVQRMLKEANVPFRVDSKLVRGLDYYTGCVYEIVAEGLGAQDALLAGGRYDVLVESLGGPKTGASGFALGVERLLMALEAQKVDIGLEISRDSVYVAAMAKPENGCAFYRQIAESLAGANKRGHFSFSTTSVANHLKRANKLGARFVILVGDDEYKTGELTLKQMSDGSQKRMKPAELERAF